MNRVDNDSYRNSIPENIRVNLRNEASTDFIPNPIKRGCELSNQFFSNEEGKNEDVCSTSTEEATWSEGSDMMINNGISFSQRILEVYVT